MLYKAHETTNLSSFVNYRSNMILTTLLVLIACAGIHADKIVGGTNADPGQFPYLVYLSYSDGFQYCGGSIYNENWVVTAAHCWRRLGENDRVVAGAHSKYNHNGQEQIRSMSQRLQHEAYNSRTIENDIMMIQMSTPLLFGSTVNSVPMQASNVAVGSPVTISGWGTTSSGGTSSEIPLYATVYTISTQQCKQLNGVNNVTDGMICIGIVEGGTDSCQGDSGGPAVLEQEGALIGITSWGYGCADANRPGVYTDVPFFIEWIESTTA